MCCIQTDKQKTEDAALTLKKSCMIQEKKEDSGLNLPHHAQELAVPPDLWL